MLVLTAAAGNKRKTLDAEVIVYTAQVPNPPILESLDDENERCRLHLLRYSKVGKSTKVKVDSLDTSIGEAMQCKEIKSISGLVIKRNAVTKTQDCNKGLF